MVYRALIYHNTTILDTVCHLILTCADALLSLDSFATKWKISGDKNFIGTLHVCQTILCERIVYNFSVFYL